MKKIILLSLFVLALMPVYFCSAQITGTVPADTNLNIKIQNPFKGGSDLREILVAVLDNIVIPIGSVVIVLAIIYSGFKFVMAQGNQKEIGDAKEGLLYVLIGAAVLLGAKAISLAVENTLKQVVNF